MKLITCSITETNEYNSTMSCFIQPYIQMQLIPYQTEPVPVPITNLYEEDQSCTKLEVMKPYIASNEENIFLSDIKN